MFTVLLKMNGAAAITAMLLLPLKLVLQKCGVSKRHLAYFYAAIAFRLLIPAVPKSYISPFNLFRTFSGKASATLMPVGTVHTVHAVAQFPTVQKAFSLLSYADAIWLVGCIAIGLYGVFSALRLKHRLRFATRVSANIYKTEQTNLPFVFGLLRPKIYVPENTETAVYPYICLHEQAHIRHLDHIIKPFAYILLAVHWFNPLNWLLFKMLAADLEYICDESVINKIGLNRRTEYANALVQTATASTSLFLGIAFSANATYHRVQNILHFKKQNRTIRLGGALLCFLLAIPFCTNALPAVHSAPSVQVSSPYRADFEETEPMQSAATEPIQAKTKDSSPVLAESSVLPQPVSISGAYSYVNNLYAEIPCITCSDSGCFSLQFSVNSNNLCLVSFYDYETQTLLESAEILADNETCHIFPDFEPQKAYKIVLQGRTQNMWQIDGTYTLF